MPRGKRSQNNSAPKTNGFEPEVLQDIVGRLDELDETLASLKGTYMKRCREIAEERKGIMVEAKARGVPMKPLKVELKVRKLSHKIEEMRSELEAEDAEQAVLIRDALGDYAELPLGAAAVSADEKRRSDADLVDDFAD